eukprot:scaffold57624_cov36-Attheya_sp.AAC.2
MVHKHRSIPGILLHRSTPPRRRLLNFLPAGRILSIVVVVGFAGLVTLFPTAVGGASAHSTFAASVKRAHRSKVSRNKGFLSQQFLLVRGGDNSITRKRSSKSAVTSPITIPTTSTTIRGGDESSSTTDIKIMSALSKIRKTIFPIYGEEVTKFFLLGFIKFFIIMALTLTRDLKDTLVVTQCGAEAIAFLKIYGVLPAATAFIALYSKMASVLEKRALFYTTCVPFFVFFVLFGVVIFPNAQLIQPSLETMQAIFGVNGDASGGMSVLAKIFSNWTSALFYVVAEIYSSVSVGILFWQFANDVVPVGQATRFYPLFAQLSGIAPILAGQYAVRFASQAVDFGSSLRRLIAAVTFAGTMICVFYHLANEFIDKQSRVAAAAATDKKEQEGAAPIPKKKKKKPKMSMTESAKFLGSSQYLRLVAMLVLGYGLSINFTEIMWKSLVKKQYPDPLDYQRFMGNFSSAVGLGTIIVIFFGVHVIRLLGWRVGAIATPSIMALLGIPFFACVLWGLDSPARLSIAVMVGTVQSLLSKTSKYALFDPTTQMAYIPLDEESKVKGKAAIDVLGSRMGKSGGSLIQQGLVFLFGNIISAAPAVAILFYSVLFSWIAAANKLSGLFLAQTELQKADQKTK